jgi:Mlc titration factor MtfA (ptsG expression regulator)
MGLFAPFRAARRRRILERSPISDELWDWALKEHRIFRWLGEGDRVRLRELATIFLGEKIFDPVDGVVVDEELRVSVAAQACLPLLGLDIDWYDDWSTIIVTPREYDVRQKDVDDAGVVHEYDDELAGEAFSLGPVALSRADIEASGWGDGFNVVIHEMAHKLDGRSGAFDGCPPLRQGMESGTWRAVFSSAFEDFRGKTERPPSRHSSQRSSRRKGSRIDSYAAESPEEFFAVVCEYFYEKPHLLRSEYPEVYAQLVLFFGRNPIEA